MDTWQRIALSPTQDARCNGPHKRSYCTAEKGHTAGACVACEDKGLSSPGNHSSESRNPGSRIQRLGLSYTTEANERAGVKDD